jgi:hypothetical protein
LNPPSSTPWRPTTFLRFEEGRGSSMDTARIVTDAGPAFIKAMGNRQGPHALACEYVGTQLAERFGLPTFDFAILIVDAEVDEIPFLKGGRARSGPAFVTRATAGHTWGGSDDELKHLVNSEAISRLVVFDTWTRNCDRHPPDLSARRPNYDNVFLEDVGPKGAGQCRVVAMDHGHCFTSGEELNARMARIDFVKDPGLYGLFPGFRSRVREAGVRMAIDDLREFARESVTSIVESVPREWEVGLHARAAWIDLILRRADFVAHTILEKIARACWPGQLFDNRN